MQLPCVICSDYMYLFITSNLLLIIVCSVSSDNNPAQMCCYDDNGDLLVGLPDGGYQSAVSPLSHLSWSLHFLMDISPYMGCCIPSGGLTVDCVAFYNKRPSDNCQGFTPWTPGTVYILS